ncbi:hypothetical protein COCSUDRAFT_53302 [Coccomyxa subellipsoidea C-169]|uniref:HMG box domain-containing protein n=1 Tax=Coccomyxa subellipsoidea (strain C-169) TaxID=574566 RepID=I0Z140_COCSC|nr:hypothetical protein COCSUDRAFT_53302 [Coccomyxa subellipsoidea C-169]EIE24359.1 hypothetical protein COCSUDRAFT_53302 [Coccomyxa subellipsoidea C-169]|eukprot:XP_005648903.1 hypothetical protein COCSUDRAFT_53302 [Coccomyxa subellipsoidea C-169]
MAGNDAGRTTAQLLQFVAAELQGAFSHIGRAMATYSETGALPPSMFGAPAATKTRKRRDKGHKRKPSAFNNYVKEKMAEIRASDNDDEDHATAIGTSIFSQAVDEWKKLSDEEKKIYAEKYKAEEGEEEGAEDLEGDEEMEGDEEGHDEGENDGEEEEPEQEPAPQEPPKVEPPQAAQPVSAKKEKKRKGPKADEPKAQAAPEQPAADEPKSDKKKKKKKDK